MSIKMLVLYLLISITYSSVKAQTVPEGRSKLSLSGKWNCQLVDQATDKPTKLDLVIDYPKKVQEFPKGKNGLWCERKIKVPKSWKGNRVFLNIGKLLYGCRIYINGQEAGELLTNGGQIDLSSHIKFGEENVLRLFFGRGGQGIKSLDPVSKAVYASLKLLTKTKGWDKGESFTGIDCLPDQFYLVSVQKNLFISDVWYQTYTRGYQ